MEDKQKQRKIDVKFILLCILLIVCLVGAIICFVHQDKLNMRPNVSAKSDINLVDDNLDLNTSWSIDTDGNLVGNNLCTNVIASGYVGDYYMASILPNTTYSIKAYGMTPNILNYGVYLYLNGNAFYTIAAAQSYNTRLTNGITFTTPSTGYPSSIESIYIKVQYNIPIENIGNIMINLGNDFLEWEPYGVWYSQGNYNNYGDVKYNEGYNVGYSEAIDDVYVNNPFYNASVKYYTRLTNTSPWFTFTLNNALLQNSNTFDVNQAIKFFLNENEQQDYYESTDVGYFKIDFVRSFNASEMVYLVNAQYPFQFDHYFTFYFDDGSQYVFHNPIVNNSADYYYQFDVDLSKTDKNGMRVVGMSFRRGASDIVNSVSQSQYNIGYNDGYSSGYSSGYDSGTSNGYTNGYDVGKKDGYSSGYSEGYELGFGETNYLRNTVFAIADTPIRVFKQIFDFNILGINIAGIVLSIMSLFVVIWLVKKVK